MSAASAAETADAAIVEMATAILAIESAFAPRPDWHQRAALARINSSDRG
jgi:hypothetical protein